MIAFFDITESLFNSAYWKKGQDKYKELTINKATGKPRTIHIPSKKLKIIQRLALEKLQLVEKFKPSRNAHGFTPGKSIVTNAIVHRRSKRIIKMDLKDFFPSIHFGRVRGMFMAYPFKFGDKAATIMAQLACLDDKSGILPQGAPLSPYIANMMCRRLDKRLTEVARSHHCYFTRYADDITFSTNDKSKSNIDDLIKETSSIIESEGFVVNKDKTKILTPEERQVVTGVIINDGINVNRRYVRNLRATLRNCEKYGINSQINKKIYRDNRASRPNLHRSLHHPSIDYFLRHLFGKINFYGSVVLSNNQDQKNRENFNLFKRIQTYENILYRFYELLKTSKEEFDPKIEKLVKRSVSKRPKLLSKLSIQHQANEIRRSVRDKFRDLVGTQDRLAKLDLIENQHTLEFFIVELAKTDPRFFKIKLGADFENAKENIREKLSFPAVSQDKTIKVLKSLFVEDGLKKLVHSDPISVKDCYRIFCDNYESEVYYLPVSLKNEFEEWISNFDKLLNKNGDSYEIENILENSTLRDPTNKLKINTRFNGSPSSSSNLKEKIKELVNKIGIEDNRVELQIDKPIGFYTHVPSISLSIYKVLDSMSKHTDEGSKIFINLKKINEKIELIIFNDSKMPLHDDFLSNRDFTNGKLSDVIRHTNGLCNYWIEAGLENGDRKILNMHNGGMVLNTDLSGLSFGFAHRFRFEK